MAKKKKTIKDKAAAFCLGNMLDADDWIILKQSKMEFVVYKSSSDEVVFIGKSKYNIDGPPQITKFFNIFKNIELYPYRKNSDKLIMVEPSSIQILVMQFKLKELGIKNYKMIKTSKKIFDNYWKEYSNYPLTIIDISDKADAALARLYFNENI